MNQPDWTTDAGFRHDTASPLGFGPFGERPPIPANDQGSSLARSVSADLEDIFAPLPADAPAAPRASPRVRTLGGAVRPDRSRRWASLGAVAAALLAGLVLGSILLKPHLKPVAAPPARTAALSVPTAADLPAPPPVAVLAPKSSAAATPEPRAKPAARHAGTSRAAVLAADRRLRGAYAAAARAGVSRDILVAARSRWAATRRDDPARVVAVYGALASDLERRAHRRYR